MKWFVIGFIIFTLFFPLIGLGILTLALMIIIIAKIAHILDRIGDDIFKAL